MPGWLRRLVAPLERRWIRDPDERARHDEVVRRRIRAPASSPDDGAPKPPEGHATETEAEPSGR